MTDNPYLTRGYSLSALRDEWRALRDDLIFLEATRDAATARARRLSLDSPAIPALEALAEEAERIIVDEIEPCASLLEEAVAAIKVRAA